MKKYHLVFFVMLFLLSCSEQAVVGISEPPPDPVPTALKVGISNPIPDRYYHSGGILLEDPLDIQVVLEGGTADRVALFLDDSLLVELDESMRYSWVTKTVPEASYQLKAKAFLGGEVFESEAKTIIIDKTPPKLVKVEPEFGEDYWLTKPIRFYFSEPITQASVDAVNLSFGALASAEQLDYSLNLSEEGTELVFQLEENSEQITQQRFFTMNWDTPLGTDLQDQAGNWLGTLDYRFRWTVPPWVQLAEPLAKASYDEPEIIIDAEARPIIAWQEVEQTNPDYVRVMRWQGDAWQQLGNDFLDASNPVLAYGNSGELYLALVQKDQTRNRDVVVYAWQEDAWQQLGDSIEIGFAYNSYLPALAVSEDGLPIVAWTEQVVLFAPSDLYVKQWTGQRWQIMGGFVQAEQGKAFVKTIKLAFNEQQNPVIAFISAGQVSVKTWDGAGWNALGSSPNQASASELDLAVLGNEIKIVWSELKDSFLSRWNGVNWQTQPLATGTMPHAGSLLSKGADELYLSASVPPAFSAGSSYERRRGVIYQITNTGLEPHAEFETENKTIIELKMAASALTPTTVVLQQGTPSLGMPTDAELVVMQQNSLP